jgi:putative FmdB family regulatory protein
MPIYEYICDRCGKFEHLHLDSNILEQCPECGAPVKRLMSAFGVIYKCGGFYTTDHRNEHGGSSNG